MIFSFENLESAALLLEERILTVVFNDGLVGSGGGEADGGNDEEGVFFPGLGFFFEAS